MKIIVRLVFFIMGCFIFVHVSAMGDMSDDEKNNAMIAFVQNAHAWQAIKQLSNQSRRIRFTNNIKQAADLFKSYDSLQCVDPVCIVNGKKLHATDECDLDVANDHCVVTIQLRPGFTQFIESLGSNFWGNLVRCVEKYIMQSRAFTFICDLTGCDTADTASLFFRAYSETYKGTYSINIKFPLGLEITLPSPIRIFE